MYKKNNFRKAILISLAFFLSVFHFFSCSKSGSPKILDKSEFIEVYTEILIISADVKSTDTIRKEKITKVLMNHKITENDFRETVKNYNKDVEDWKKIYKEISDKLDKSKSTQINK
jgi:hypothetical protein